MQGSTPRGHFIDICIFLLEKHSDNFRMAIFDCQLQRTVLIDSQSSRVTSFDQQKGNNISVASNDSFVEGITTVVSDLVQ